MVNKRSLRSEAPYYIINLRVQVVAMSYTVTQTAPKPGIEDGTLTKKGDDRVVALPRRTHNVEPVFRWTIATLVDGVSIL
jgi:hypothetical protein